MSLLGIVINIPVHRIGIHGDRIWPWHDDVIQMTKVIRQRYNTVLFSIIPKAKIILLSMAK